MADTDPALVALKDCGCLVAAMVDTPEYRRSNAKQVSDLMRAGFVIQRVTVEQGRALPWAGAGGVCKHDPVQEELLNA